MIERDLVARDPVFFTWTLDKGCLVASRLLKKTGGVKNKKTSAHLRRIANAAGLDVFTGPSLRCRVPADPIR